VVIYISTCMCIYIYMYIYIYICIHVVIHVVGIPRATRERENVYTCARVCVRARAVTKRCREGARRSKRDPPPLERLAV
jgi:hypothetical protein